MTVCALILQKHKRQGLFFLFKSPWVTDFLKSSPPSEETDEYIDGSIDWADRCDPSVDEALKVYCAATIFDLEGAIYLNGDKCLTIQVSLKENADRRKFA